MPFDFIFMLTSNDQTIPDARTRLEQVLAGGALHIGCRDIGLPASELKALAASLGRGDVAGRSG